MLDKAIGPNVIRDLKSGLSEFIERNASKGWKNVEDFRGLRRDRVVVHSKIRRPTTLNTRAATTPKVIRRRRWKPLKPPPLT
jgi:hypothetical protein